MNSKDKSTNNQGNTTDNNVSNKNVTHTEHRSKAVPNSDYIDPFYTPPGEGPKPRITSN
ncbi:hypothetical protein [Lacrimispora celerecrescens]|uniref:hypothetical protein n=1 Tax=Lacrimispora celerecrescens TaxID=29354 RepID=UPI0012FE33A9|nr:hypothetical protein [Lacrimispora celerecrescens]